jgi:hypothetical protein
MFSSFAVTDLSEGLVDDESQEDMICKSKKVMRSLIPETNSYTKKNIERLEKNGR